ncbi:unnamed protein product [Protopolystoma xenopodis]|uniref:Uncharacterized protein n=1 Tax=Protopolystoma xenopodis TaxID=117903 RepID=A0A3S5CLM5_9PLAT|nr:unnamed protein product [Protopolystoma xenopodis]
MRTREKLMAASTRQSGGPSSSWRQLVALPSPSRQSPDDASGENRSGRPHSVAPKAWRQQVYGGKHTSRASWVRGVRGREKDCGTARRRSSPDLKVSAPARRTALGVGEPKGRMAERKRQASGRLQNWRAAAMLRERGSRHVAQGEIGDKARADEAPNNEATQQGSQSSSA